MSQLRNVAKGVVYRPASHILVRDVPKTCTPGDIRRALIRAEIKGVSNIDLLYKHFRPTGKAVLGMTLPHFLGDAMRGIEILTLNGSRLSATRVYDVDSYMIQGSGLVGDGPGGGVPGGRTVTLSGFRGSMKLEAAEKLFKTRGYDVEKVIPTRLPSSRFSLFSRFTVILKSESEAHRLYREMHQHPISGETIEAQIMH